MRKALFIIALSATWLPQSALAQTQVEAMRQALAQERAAHELKLSDAWMKHLDEEEHDRLALYPLGTVLLGLGAVGWGLGAALDADGGTSAGTYALAGASGVTLGFAVASFALSDPYLRRDVGHWGLLLQYTMLGAMALARSDDSDCRHDCSATLVTLGAGIIAWSIGVGLGELIFPEVYVSKHYAEYQALSSGERAGYARDLMLRADATCEKRNVLYYLLNMSLASGIASGIGAVDGRNARLSLGVTAGSIVVTSTVVFIASLLTRSPSERMMLGFAPPVTR